MRSAGCGRRSAGCGAGNWKLEAGNVMGNNRSVTVLKPFLRKLSVLVVLTAAAGCGDSPTSPAPAFSQTDLRAGSGSAAANGSALTVQYTGWLYDGTKADQKGLRFETNVGGTAFPFTLGVGQVIAGWDQGLLGIQPGGIRRLVIPPALAYGSIRNGPIPPNATLIFEIEVLNIQ